MKKTVVPHYLLRATAFTDGTARLVSPVEVKKDRDGEVRHNGNFPGKTPYRTQLEIINGWSEIRLPSGEIVPAPRTRQISITIWGETAPALQPGEFVVAHEPLFGSFEGRTYVQCLGLSPAENDDLATALGKESE